MKLVIFAGPPTCGKTTVIRQVLKRMVAKEIKTAYLKIDVLYADDDTIIGKEFGIPVKKIYSGELCPDHCNVVVLDEAVEWAEKSGEVTFSLKQQVYVCVALHMLKTLWALLFLKQQAE